MDEVEINPNSNVFAVKGNGGGMSSEITPTLVGDHNNRITDFTAVIIEVRNGREE